MEPISMLNKNQISNLSLQHSVLRSSETVHTLLLEGFEEKKRTKCPFQTR